MTMLLTYRLSEVAPYINWIYFDHAWGVSGQPEAERELLRREAAERLSRYEHSYATHAVFQLFDAYSQGDDIVLTNIHGDASSVSSCHRLPCLRQQQSDSLFLCLADFVAPKAADGSEPQAYAAVGVFATTVDTGMETDFDDDPYEKMMMQLLADRLAEATAEVLHEQVRKVYWGYAPDEHLSIGDMLAGCWQGVRPAVGYPSLPDTSLNFLIDRLIGMRQIGIRLTETGSMRPHASVSGLMLDHPRACYFSVGKIGADQLSDYARRRGMDADRMRTFLSTNL